MCTNAISGLSSAFLQSIFNNVIETGGLCGSSSSTTTNNIGSTLLSQQPDSGSLSPFAQMLNTLQQLQQNNPTQYAQVTGQIATNLQSAAKTAQADGNTTAANQLTELSNDFSSASKSGQLPNIQDLAQAAGAGHHHHHGHGGSASSGSSSSSQSLMDLLASQSTSSSQSDSLDPMSIIMQTLSSANVGNSNT